MNKTTDTRVIEQFAENLSLNIWDWFAAIVAFASFLIAISSLIIACKTLKSQKATQRNTAPLITKDIQRMLWLQLIELVHSNLMRMHALRILLERNKYSKKPEEYFIQGFYINPEDYVHEELFYTDGYRFNSVHGLKERINIQNNLFDFIANRLKEQKITPLMINRMITHINSLLSKALYSYWSAFRKQTILYHGNEIFRLGALDEEIFEELKGSFENNNKDFLDYQGRLSVSYGTVLKESERYKEEDQYVVFFKRYVHGKSDNFIKDYYDYSNKYLEYYLTDCNIVLENQ